MRTLVLCGAVRQNGDTRVLLDAFLAELGGEVLIADASADIAPCRDCRYCQTHEGCAIRDDMDAVYRFLDDCGSVVIASPVWYASLSGPLFDIASRFQPMFYAGLRGVKPPARSGAILLTGGHAGSEAGAERSARIILRTLGVRSPVIVKSMDTDRIPAKSDAAALEAAREAARMLKGEANENWNQ